MLYVTAQHREQTATLLQTKQSYDRLPPNLLALQQQSCSLGATYRLGWRVILFASGTDLSSGLCTFGHFIGHELRDLERSNRAELEGVEACHLLARRLCSVCLQS